MKMSWKHYIMLLNFNCLGFPKAFKFGSHVSWFRLAYYAAKDVSIKRILAELLLKCYFRKDCMVQLLSKIHMGTVTQ